MPRPLVPEDLYRLRIATDPRLSPDGSTVAFTVQVVAAGKDAYRHAIWLVPADGSAEARQVTLGAKHDTRPRFSPDGRSLAFLSDRRLAVEDDPDAPKDREDGVQVHLLPLAGGEARRLTDLPRGVENLAWSPDGSRLVVATSSRAANREADARVRGKGRRREPGSPPPSDYRYIDRLQYLHNGPGFVYDRVPHLWLVDAASGQASRLTDGPTPETDPAWSPDGTRIAFAAARGRDPDLDWQFDVFVADVATGRVQRVTDGAGCAFFAPAWLPDGRTLAVLGHRFPAAGASRNDLWLFAADGSEALPGGGRNLTAPHDLMFGAGMGSDLTVGEEPRLAVTADGTHVLATAPVDGSYELWRVSLTDGTPDRLTEGRHYLSSWHAVALGSGGGMRVAVLRSSPTELPDVHILDLGPDVARAATRRRSGASLEKLTALNAEALADVRLLAPEERWETVDGRRIQGWLIRAADASAPAPLVLEIHGGPHTLYGWAPSFEFQVLAGAGMSVLYTNPRGSEGYGQDFNAANLPDWGDGPMADVLAHVDALVADGTVDPARLGVTGGSYGGYLTNWIVGHDQRFAAALTCRSVTDLTSLMLTGDLAGGVFGRLEFGVDPWRDPELYRRLSPITYADGMRTPLLIQHAENDLRCPMSQAEALFAILRTKRRPVRLMRVPEETHELTRSGTPFRRVENAVQVRDWFAHFLVRGSRRMPPLPRNRAGR
jgi:dipeptidyl aminopeptidase/acylaminoacyl peptidase